MKKAPVQVSPVLETLRQKLPEFCARLVKKLMNPHLEIDIKLTEINGTFYHKISLVYQLLTGAAKNQDKVHLNLLVREQIRWYLRSQASAKLNDIAKIREDAHLFIESVSQFWDNYQRFVFTFKLITEKASIFFRTFNKLQEKIRSSSVETEVQPVAVLAVNELKDHMENKQVYRHYSKIFCDFIQRERNGIVVPREKVKESIEFFESTNFDFDAEALRIGDRLFIRKRYNNEAQHHRHSTADKFFDNHIMGSLLRDCKKFYQDFVEKKALSMSAPQQITQMNKFIDEEESRAQYYIHEERNYNEYMNCINDSLIMLKLEQRIMKETGLRKYFRKYEYGKNEFVEQIEGAWKVYHRIFNQSKKHILKIYSDYFLEDGKALQDIIAKGPDFIAGCILLNKKNMEIVRMLGGMLDFDRIRVESIEKILSNQLGRTQEKKNDGGKFYQGAKHIAGVFHQKIRAKYAKEESFGQDEEDLLNLFKILKYKMMCLKEYTRHLGTRLLEDLDMTKDGIYSNAIALETKIIEEMKKESSENDVKNLQQCVRDITKSEQLFANLKKKTEFGKKYHFLNQLIVKNNIFWFENPFFDVKPPQILLNCVNDTMKELENSGNIQFQLSNGISVLRATYGKNKYNFTIRSLYAIILFCIDEKKSKKMYYNELIDQLTPGGRQVERAYVELQRYLVELCVFGLLKTNKPMGKDDVKTLAKMEGSDWFEVNKNFVPQKKAPMYKTPMLAMVPPHIREALQASQSAIGESDKEIERIRRVICELHIVQKLKHAHTNKNTVTIEELQHDFDTEKRLKEWDINARFMKETLEGLIHKFFCERVEGKKNTLRYVA